jgi:hypothetical protein
MQVDPCDELPSYVSFRRLPCMAHTLKLLIKPVYAYYNTLLTKTRHLVGHIQKSEIAIEKLIGRCEKSVISDCTTRWISTCSMVTRLLLIKIDITEFLIEVC